MSQSSRPAPERLWIILIDAGSLLQLPQAQQWRDHALLPALGALAGVRELRAYCAFNLPELAVLAQLAEGADLNALSATSLQLPPGVRLRQDFVQPSFEHVQTGVTQPQEAGLLYSVRFVVPPAWHDEFDRWYEQEHIPMIYGCKDWAMSRRYRFAVPGANTATHLALHWLSDARALDAPELRAARATPWRRKFLGERWVTDVDKMIYFRQRLPA